MSNIEDLKTYMARKKGETLLEDLVENLTLAVEQGLVKDLIFVGVQTDGEIVHGCNTMDSARIIGLLEVAKYQVIGGMYEEI